MRVLVTTFPGLGHFHPLAPLALSLRSHGHDVLVATGPDLVDWVQRCGLDAKPAGLSQPDAVRKATDLAQPGEHFGLVMFAKVAPAAMLSDLEAIAISWRPDLIVHEEGEYAAPLLGARLDVPCVTHSWPAPAPTADVSIETLTWLEPLWSDETGRQPQLSGELYLDACPPPMQSLDVQIAAARIPVRAVPFDGPPRAIDPALAQLGRPTAYVSFGTVPKFSDATRLSETVHAVAAEVPSVIVTSGPNAPGAIGAVVPESVVVRDYLPLRHVLAYSDLVVSHGGAGTTVAALTAGLPHLVMPQGAPSQDRNADAVLRTGSGLALTAPEQSVAAVRESVRRLVDDASFATAARELAGSLASLPGPDEVSADLAARYG